MIKKSVRKPDDRLVKGGKSGLHGNAAPGNSRVMKVNGKCSRE